MLKPALSLAPKWLIPVVAAVALLGSTLVVVVVVTGTLLARTSTDIRYQCDSAIGPDHSADSASVPEQTTSRATEPSVPFTAPATNPYRDLTLDPDSPPWDLACASAMREAPYQLPELETANSTYAAECVGRLARSMVGTGVAAHEGSVAGSPDGALDPATMAGYVIHQCAAVGDPVVLPNTIAQQALSGQRVREDAASPGDLVFWDYRAFEPTRIGIAVGGDEMVSADEISGTFQLRTIPSDARIKRVLSSR